uniref:Uncharacterized protein n=1 Tax=Aegilops tauschii subsp. strangulata TaxID=200361 RepID=A0A453RJL4_AEGTS
LNHLNMDNGHKSRLLPPLNSGYESMLRQGMGVGFRNGAANAAAAAVDSSGGGGGRLKGQLSFSSRQGSLMSQISEMGSEDLGGSSPEGAGGSRGYIPGYPMSSGWEESSLMSENMSGMKRPRDSSEPAAQGVWSRRCRTGWRTSSAFPRPRRRWPPSRSSSSSRTPCPARSGPSAGAPRTPAASPSG